MEYRTTREPDDIDLILRLHFEGYQNLDWRFESDCLDAFLVHVQDTLAEVNLDDRQSNRIWFAEESGETLGCAGLLKRGTKGQLRWVVSLPKARGLGIGKQLVQQALNFARDLGLEEVFLDTIDGIDASMSLYNSMGFVVESNSTEQMWFGAGSAITMTIPLQKGRPTCADRDDKC